VILHRAIKSARFAARFKLWTRGAASCQGAKCVTEDFSLPDAFRGLGLGVQGGGEAVVLVQGVFHISGEFGAYGFRQFVLYPVEVALRGLDPLIELSGESGLAQSDPAAFRLPRRTARWLVFFLQLCLQFIQLLLFGFSERPFLGLL